MFPWVGEAVSARGNIGRAGVRNPTSCNVGYGFNPDAAPLPEFDLHHAAEFLGVYWSSERSSFTLDAQISSFS